MRRCRLATVETPGASFVMSIARHRQRNSGQQQRNQRGSPMQRSGPVKVPRNLAAYMGRQRRYDEQRQRSEAASTPTTGRPRLQPVPGQSPPPDYGCVEWYMYEPRRDGYESGGTNVAFTESDAKSEKLRA
jgi:hypothetical protein